MEVTQEFISIGCNRLTQALAWGADGLAAFGAHHAVALYYPMVFFMLNQRNVAIVSGSADKTARIWKRQGSRGNDGQWICSAVLEGHTGSVITLGVVRARSIHENQGKDLLATGSGDGTIKIWERKEYPQSIAISYLPKTTVPIMAVGSTDNKINIYLMHKNQFEKVLSLQGHDNWVRSLDFTTFTKDEAMKKTSHHHTLQDGDLLLASGSQDKYIRLWRISAVDKKEEEQRDEAQNEGSEGALLLGHEDWVYTINWQPAMNLNGKYHQPMSLLSASTDKSMMIWKPDEATGVWVNNTQMGEVGGNTIGFYGGLFGPDGRWILAYGYNGAFHIWKNEGDEIGDRWMPQVPASGHYAPVQDLTWDPTQSYLVTVSLDQTARLFSPWTHTISKGNGNNDSSVTETTVSTWHEIARPQIHGYDVQCIAFSSKYTFISGSDEKVLRVFDAPQTFVRSLAYLTANDSLLGDESSRPVGANLPALGLSNKAVFENDIASMVEAQESEEYLSQQSFVSTGATPTSLVETMTHPPFEEHLLQHTLWPEVEKLFGHGYELMCVDASHDGEWIASACKAHTPDQAGVRLFNAKTWKQTPHPLQSHTLTVTKVKFSHSDKYLLSISRDRLWSLFERVEDSDDPYKLVASNKAHARILWDCSWSYDDSLFATGSRDKTIKIWSKTAQVTPVWNCIATIKLPEAVTAVEFAPKIPAENGDVPEAWSSLGEIKRELTHIGTVNGLAWRLATDESAGVKNKLQLASCSADHSVRLFNIRML
ncbi:WD40-repeat-containing domain protein [Lobosporangium transversale]|uniref:Elongator complex protein 2 n=1 Tax=Lobosporangium transversale TaxID=64571 RepID=A0A1Y2H392_9FUNG|nr:WD40-repeat-containing domain protein [Lobosporangium transversale]ORZ27542.1 WD40-repeat-containing domain protein [Lobosporangium transversale]|eukprot:XP_021885269.1 WD40-repeat-containing domain protein [Lobosporangium transversale]